MGRGIANARSAAARARDAVMLVVASVLATVSLAQSQLAPPPRHIPHGESLGSTDVGPAAAGYAQLRGPYPGAEIRDGREYPFVRMVPATARYDGFDVTGPHLLIEGVSFDGPLDIYATKPVVLRGVSVRTSRAAYWAVHTRPEAGAFYFLWSEAGASRTDGAPSDRTYALDRALYLRADRATVHRSRISRTADGIQIHAVGAIVSETLIDDLVFWVRDHNDGIQMLGRGADLTVVRSRIVNRNPQTSCLNLIGNRVRVEDSYLAGGGWVIYGGAHANGHKAGPARNVVVRNVIFGRTHFPRAGHFGPVAYWDSSADTGNVWERNRFDDGRAVRP